MSGGQAGAENGALTVMIGGDQADFDKAKDKIDCYSKKMKLLGNTGSGQLAKMVNQICIAGLVQGLSEGINFGIKVRSNQGFFTIQQTCHECSGYGETISNPCKQCSGNGKTQSWKNNHQQ